MYRHHVLDGETKGGAVYHPIFRCIDTMSAVTVCHAVFKAISQVKKIPTLRQYSLPVLIFCIIFIYFFYLSIQRYE